MRRELVAAKNNRIILRLVQCAWCGRVRIGPWYVSIGRKRLFVREWSLHPPLLPSMVVGTTHAICPECLERVKGNAHAWQTIRAARPPRGQHASIGGR